MTVNYTVIQCNILHYTVQYTATHGRVEKKKKDQTMQLACEQVIAPEHTAATVLLKTNINAE